MRKASREQAVFYFYVMLVRALSRLLLNRSCCGEYCGPNGRA